MGADGRIVASMPCFKSGGRRQTRAVQPTLRLVEDASGAVAAGIEGVRGG